MAKSEQATGKFNLAGTWHIYEMEEWDEDYFNMETQAYVDIDDNNSGEFQFGLVVGSFNGYLEDVSGKKRFSFTWEGNDETDEASGSGWVQLAAPDQMEGLIKFHGGDRSLFKARRA